MSLPIIHTALALSDFVGAGSWDALILVTDDRLSMLSQEWRTVIERYREFDAAAQNGVHLIHCTLAPQSRVVLCCVGTRNHEGDDLRQIQKIAAEGMRRTLLAGSQRPCLQVSLDDESGAVLEAAFFGVCSALWVPLEAREVTRGRSIEALGVVTGDREDLQSDDDRALWLRYITAIEIGRSVARDVTGTEPERMSPPKIAELCKKAFRGSDIDVEIVKDRHVLEQEYPLLSAVARASWSTERHQPRVIRLKYLGGEAEQQTIMLAGKGVTYDTGGADLKTGGHMAGMSRDKGGAGAVIGMMLTIAHLRPKMNFIAEIGAVRNSIGADCFVTDEIVTAHSGQRVRIGNTDAEGRLVLADLLSHLRCEVDDRCQSHLISIATLTGHAYRAVGPFTIAIDNEAVRSTTLKGQNYFNAQSFQHRAELYGEGVEISRLRKEDFDMIHPPTISEDVISSNNAPSSMTARGHQFPAAFLIRASGLSNDGLTKDNKEANAYRYTHIDIGGSGVENGDWQHGRPTAAPVLGLIVSLIKWSTYRQWMSLLLILIMMMSSLSEWSHARSLPDQGIETSRKTGLLKNEAMGTGGMVVSDNLTASKIGMEVLKEGGDAVDAAIATTFALGVLQPFASGIGGGGFAVIYRKSQQYALDFREVAPAAATKDMYLDAQKEPIKYLSTVGALAAGVPGEVAGLYELHRRHGKLAWARLVEPAMNLATHGYHMHELLYKNISNNLDRVRKSPQLSKILLKNNRAKPIGTLIKFSDLGKTLKVIADQGAKGFYEGKVAQEMVTSINQAQGIITLQDLNNYRVKDRQVLRGKYYGYTLLSMPPPSSGGLVIIQALKSLESILGDQTPSDLGRYSSTYLHALTEALKHGFADRAEYMGDPDFTVVPVKRLLSEERIKEISQKFNVDRTLQRSEYGANILASTDGGTSHLNVLDAQGHAVALTTTINTGFGSRFIAGSSGVLMNNEMDDFIVKPGVPNAYGLVGKASNAVQAQKRPLSSMSPTILLKDEEVVGMVGGSGGPTIITGTIQTLLNLIHFDGTTGEVGRAVNEPRIHHQWVPETLMYDQGFTTKTLEGLLARGHKIRQWPMRFTAIQALWVLGRKSSEDKIMIGASDPSKLGCPAVVTANKE